MKVAKPKGLIANTNMILSVAADTRISDFIVVLIIYNQNVVALFKVFRFYNTQLCLLYNNTNIACTIKW